MKFNLDVAWRDTSRLLKDNFGLLAVLAGVFYFIPNALMMLAIPQFRELSNLPADASQEAAQAIVVELFANYWWALLIAGIVQSIGMLAMLALLSNRSNHTVGEAIQIGARSVMTYIVASLIQGLVVGLIGGIVMTIGALTGVGFLAIVFILLALTIAVYAMAKFSMTAPIIVTEGQMNPVSALMESWQLTKGNSFRLVGFFLLILVPAVIVWLVFSMLAGLLFSLGQGEVMDFAQTIMSALANTLWVMIFVSVVTAMYTQLRRLNEPRQETELMP